MKLAIRMTIKFKGDRDAVDESGVLDLIQADAQKAADDLADRTSMHDIVEYVEYDVR